MSPQEFQHRNSDVIASVAEYEVGGTPAVDFTGHQKTRFGIMFPGGWASYPDPAALYEPALRALRLSSASPLTAEQRESAARAWLAKQARSLADVLEDMACDGVAR